MVKNEAKFFKVAKLSLFTFSLLFSVLLILCPIFQPNDTIKDLSGRVGIMDNYSLISTMDLPWRYVYVFGDIWCHQKGERSLFINGNQMPVCARCFGTFIGVPFGIGISMLIKIAINDRLHKKILALLLIGYSPILTDSIGQVAKLWDSTNFLRLTTGILAGSTFGIILGILINVIEKFFNL